MLQAENADLSTSPKTPAASRYGSILEQTSTMIRGAGHEINAFSPDRISKFSGFGEAKQEAIIAGATSYLRLCQSAIEKGIPLRDENHAIAWSAIRDLGWQPLSDVFSTITKDVVVELYDQNGIQLFRSFNFYACLSYSLDDLSTHEFWELYHREAPINALVLDTVDRALKSTIPTTFSNPAPRHVVTEIFSRRRKSAEIEPRAISPLLSNSGQPRGFMHVFKILSITNHA